MLLIAFLSLFYDSKGRMGTAGYKKGWLLSFVILVLLAGLRNEIGIDTYTYSLKYEDMPDLFSFFKSKNFIEDYSIQILWSLFLSFFKTIGADWVVVQFVIALVFNGLLFRFLNKVSTRKFTTLFCIIILSWWNLSFEVLRESICIVLLLNGLLELENNKIKRFFLWCLPAFFVHWFSFFPILMVYLACKTSYKFLLFASLFLGILIFILGKAYVTDQLLLLSVYFSNDMSTRISDYADIVRDASVIGILFEFVTIALAPAIISICFNKKQIYLLLSKVLLLYIPFVALRFAIPIFYRLLNYLEIPFAVAVVLFLGCSEYKNKSIKLLVFGLLLFCLIKSANDFYKPSPIETRNINYDCRYIPYTSVFEPTDETRDDLYRIYK